MELTFGFLYLWFLIGTVAVTSNPSPQFGILGIVLVSTVGCSVLALLGYIIFAMILFFIYVGGMLVVFAYTAALAADPFPESWSEVTVFEYMVYLCLGVVVGLMYATPVIIEYSTAAWSAAKEFSVSQVDWSGLATLFAEGGLLLFVCGWNLLLALFVVLELVRGLSRGAMRVP
uniref:NADH-ubiquinone oxidoreductase chain 6 n=1 Tax=Harengula jaguana TaxID=224705 RepID=H1UC40_HARJA|nr:NADH dehydrogenase subunit 6 [Harengula jaguana]WNH19278.1 NADH dehydrogenase subunit 6 [Harengula clupeola]BAL43711.1 NADH dehydrogenase subunit 6 [Harengula jaguana]